ncbi:hypothetical protein HAX54_010207, partial [Datura stramonium]|nr:hypothetical protein [Datura stramonium]
MAPKPSKEKGLASSSHGSKEQGETSEEEHEDGTTTIEALWAPLGHRARSLTEEPLDDDVATAHLRDQQREAPALLNDQRRSRQPCCATRPGEGSDDVTDGTSCHYRTSDGHQEGDGLSLVLYGPDDSIDDCESSDGPPEEKFLDSGATADLTDRQSRDGPSL